MLVSPTDFVMVRFTTKPHHFMRMAHVGISEWLTRNQIQFTRIGRTVYFEMPQHLKQYEVITPELAEALSPFATEIKRKLSALSWTAMGKVRQPLSHEELRHLSYANIPIIL